MSGTLDGGKRTSAGGKERGRPHSTHVGEHVALLDDTELMGLLDGLHDETRLLESGFRVVGVVGEGSNDALSVDVTAFVHEPAGSCGRKADRVPISFPGDPTREARGGDRDEHSGRW